MLNVRRSVPAILVAAAVMLPRLASLPRSVWRSEEIRFLQAIVSFDPLHRQPDPPAYPLYVALTRAAAFFTSTPFDALLLVSAIATVVGAYFFARAAGEIADDELLGAAASLILFGSPAFLIFTPLPNPSGAAAAFLSIALSALVTRRYLAFGLASAAIIGCLPQSGPAVVVFFVFGVVLGDAQGSFHHGGTEHTEVHRGTAIFVIGTAFCFVPVVEAIATGGLARYASQSLAEVRRASEASGLHGVQLVLRFVAHPWGAKWMSAVILILALTGAVIAWRRRNVRALPLLAFSIAALLFSIAFSDRSSGVEPVLLTLFGTALLAALAFNGRPRIAIGVAAAYAVAAVVYASPVLRLRHDELPPAVSASKAAAVMLPSRGVLLYESPYEAYAQMFAPGRRQADFARLDEFAADPAIPLVLLGDGASPVPRAETFSWPDSDAYGKLTTERFRVASVVLLPLDRRYAGLSGVHPLERAHDGREWRWLAPRARIRLIPIGCSAARIALALPPFAPMGSTIVTVDAGAGPVRAKVVRGAQVSIDVPLKKGSTDLFFSAPSGFISGAEAERGDGRQLAVQLLSLQQLCSR